MLSPNMPNQKLSKICKSSWVWLIYTTRLFQVLHGDVATFWCIIRQTQPWLGVKQWERLLLLQRKHWWRSHSSHKLAIGYIFHLQQMALTRQSPAIGKQILGTASILQQEAAEKKYSALTGVTCLISGHKAFPTFPGGPTVHHIYWPQTTDILYVQTVWTMVKQTTLLHFWIHHWHSAHWGKDNRVADSFSRATIDSVQLGIDYPAMATDQAKDPEIQSYRTSCSNLVLQDILFGTGCYAPLWYTHWRYQTCSTCHMGFRPDSSLVSPLNIYHSIASKYVWVVCKSKLETGQRQEFFARVQKFTNTLRLHFKSSASLTIVMTTFKCISSDSYHRPMVSPIYSQ